VTFGVSPMIVHERNQKAHDGELCHETTMTFFPSPFVTLAEKMD
jgi:hypothetical protein